MHLGGAGEPGRPVAGRPWSWVCVCWVCLALQPPALSSEDPVSDLLRVQQEKPAVQVQDGHLPHLGQPGGGARPQGPRRPRGDTARPGRHGPLSWAGRAWPSWAACLRGQVRVCPAEQRWGDSGDQCARCPRGDLGPDGTPGPGGGRPACTAPRKAGGALGPHTPPPGRTGRISPESRLSDGGSAPGAAHRPRIGFLEDGTPPPGAPWWPGLRLPVPPLRPCAPSVAALRPQPRLGPQPLSPPCHPRPRGRRLPTPPGPWGAGSGPQGSGFPALPPGPPDVCGRRTAHCWTRWGPRHALTLASTRPPLCKAQPHPSWA